MSSPSFHAERIAGRPAEEDGGQPKSTRLRCYRALADAFLERRVEPRCLAEELDRVVDRIERLARDT